MFIMTNKPGTVTTIVADPPVFTYLDPGKVGSSGQPGWDDAACQSVAQSANDWKAVGDQRDDLQSSARAYLIASLLEGEVYDNCIVQD